ncbi:MAG: class I SAM-dependent methyltransferase, partial [Chitinophagales bacterium]
MDIYKKAHYYDCINDFDFDVDFFVDFARKQGGNVLELACGTGRLTIPLAKEAIKITGIDNAKEMLQLAEEKATKLGLNVDFYLKNLLD